MAKPLRVILEAKVGDKKPKIKGVKSSTVHKGGPTDEYPGLGPKEKDGQDFVAAHEVEVHDDRAGNTNKIPTKPAKYKKQSSSVYEASKNKLSNYVLDARDDAEAAERQSNFSKNQSGNKSHSPEKRKDFEDESKWLSGIKDKRDKGIELALSKIKNKAKVNATEAASCDTAEPHENPKGKKLLLGGKKPQEVQERHMTSRQKAKEEKIKKKVDPSEMKASMKTQYGPEEGKNIYFATIRKRAMESVMEKRKIKETTGPDTPTKMPSGKVGDNANSPGFNV